MDFTITRRLDSTLNELSEEFSTVYCDRDFHRALNALKNSDEGNWPQNLHRLNLMLKACGFNYKLPAHKGYAYYEKLIDGLVEQGVIITSDKMSQSILGACQKLFEKFREYPTPTDYMQRLVDRLCFPGDPWQEDSLRLRIMKQFIKYGNYLAASELGKKRPIQEYVGVKLGKEKVTDDEVLQNLDDHIFALILVPSAQEIELVMRQTAAAMPAELPGQKLRELILNAETAALPSSFDEEDYQAAIELLLHPDAMNHLTAGILIRHAIEALGRENVTEAEAREALGEKVCEAIARFASAGISHAVTKGENRNSIIRSISRELRTTKNPPTTEQLLSHLYSQLHTAIRKQNREDYLLLQISDDLASGQFDTNGATKRNLFLFAVVYDMRYYTARPNTVYDGLRDVEKNLFTDYYAANVLQYLSPTYLNGKTKGEIIPSGCSINYKNYAEMIYLYNISLDRRQFLSKEELEKLPEDEILKRVAVEKLKRAEAMIKAVKVREKDAAAPSTADREEGATNRMRDRIFGHPDILACEDVLALPEQAFMDFIVQNFDRRVHIGKTDISPFKVNADDRTALAEYTRIVKDLLGSPDDPQGDSPLREYQDVTDLIKLYARDASYDSAAKRNLIKEFSYGLAFDEAHELSDGEQSAIDQDFRQLLVSVDNFLREWTDKKKINRATLLAALYYDFNERHINGNKLYRRSFQEHYHLFCREINPILEKCNYALISGKSLLDMLLVFSSYTYINT